MYERPDKGGANAEIREVTLEAILAEDCNYVAALSAQEAATTAYRKAVDALEIARLRLDIEKILASTTNRLPA